MGAASPTREAPAKLPGMRLSCVVAIALLAGCVGSRNLPRVTPDVRSVGQGRAMGENDQWNEARRELDSLASACEEERARLEEDADSSDRARRVTTALSVGAVVAGELGDRYDTHSGVSIGEARCTPVSGPNLTAAPGSAAYSSGCRSTAAGGGGPSVASARATRASAESRVDRIQRALETAFDFLDAHRQEEEWTDDDEAEWHEHEVEIESLCRRD